MSKSTGEADGIDYFGRDHFITGLQARISVGVRRRMFQAWLDYAGSLADRAVLDVGGTPDRERADSNCMIPWLHESGARVSMYSLEDLSVLADTFPYVQLLPPLPVGEPYPAEDAEYDWAVSSAVLEHVGGRDGQIAFVRECSRVSRGLFLTTPNRRHWLEFHTKLPFLHWLPRGLHRSILRAVGHDFWSRRENLELLSARDLREVALRALPAGWEWSVSHVWALGMPSNLLLLARAPRE